MFDIDFKYTNFVIYCFCVVICILFLGLLYLIVKETPLNLSDKSKFLSIKQSIYINTQILEELTIHMLYALLVIQYL